MSTTSSIPFCVFLQLNSATLLRVQIHLLRLGSQTGRGRRSLGKHHHDSDGRGDRAELGRGRDSRVVVVHGAKNSGEVTGLHLYSRYELSVTAFNSKGEGPHSLPHHFVTPEGGECQCRLLVSP